MMIFFDIRLIGTKSRTTSYGIFCINGKIQNAPPLTTRLWPSGAELARKSYWTTPLPRFSTTTGWPSTGASPSAS